jgi:competence protein ComEC
MSGNTSSSKTFQRALAAIDSNNVNYHEPRMGEGYKMGPLQIDVLYPSSITEDDNGESISLKLTYGSVRFIFTGDANKDDELKMINSGIDMRVDIVQLGHHGSDTSTHQTFLDKVNPAVAIYSASVDNSYGHPHAEVVSRVNNHGIKLYGTDVHGTIIVKTNGKKYTIMTKKEGTVTAGSTHSNNDDTSGDNNSSSEDEEEEEEYEEDPPATTINCIDINTASIEELQQIIHIGTTRAQNLIDLRSFSSVDDLDRIKGIGPSRIEDIKAQGLACVGG